MLFDSRVHDSDCSFVWTVEAVELRGAPCGVEMSCCGLSVAGRDDDFERTKKLDFKGEYHGVEEPVVSVN